MPMKAFDDLDRVQSLKKPHNKAPNAPSQVQPTCLKNFIAHGRLVGRKSTFTNIRGHIRYQDITINYPRQRQQAHTEG